ncbi:MAG: outer membrane beta-barrel protein [Verrucomicrobiota bacterium]
MKLLRGLLILSALSIGSGANAQGLVGFAGDDDFYSALPFTTSLGVDFGWDSNPGATSLGDAQDTAFVRGGADLAWGGGSRTTPIRIAGSLSGLYYFDEVERLDEEFFWNTRLSVNISHSVNRRLTVGSNSFISYEIEPDYAVGFSLQNRSGQYLYGYNSFWATYQLSRRLNAVTRYEISGILYDEGEFNSEDRFVQTIREELRFKWTRLTTLIGEYRFSNTHFSESNRDSDSHFFLIGADRNLSRQLTSHYRVGAQIRRDTFGDSERPYAELAYRYQLAEKTSLHFANRLSLEESEIAGFRERYTWRSVLSVRHQITARLNGNASLVYLHNEFSGSTSFTRPDRSEDLVSGTLGLSYLVLSNLSVNANYSFTSVHSDDEFREYDRHRVSLGMSTTF